MISIIIDITQDFNEDYLAQIDVGGWDYAVVQFINPAGTVSFKATNDSGGVTGVYDGDQTTATNWVAIQGINLNNNTGATSTNATSMFRFTGVGKFLQFSSVNPNGIGKLLVELNKIK